MYLLSVFSKNSVETIIIIIVIFLLYNNRSFIPSYYVIMFQRSSCKAYIITDREIVLTV